MREKTADISALGALVRMTAGGEIPGAQNLGFFVDFPGAGWYSVRVFFDASDSGLRRKPQGWVQN